MLDKSMVYLTIFTLFTHVLLLDYLAEFEQSTAIFRPSFVALGSATKKVHTKFHLASSIGLV